MLYEEIENQLDKPSSVKDVLNFKDELKKEILNFISEKDLSISSTVELLNELANDLIYSNNQKLKQFIDSSKFWAYY